MRDAGGAHKWPLPPGVEGRAVFSPDGEYRYVLRREWDTTGPICTFVGLNPSTAEHDVDDPTVRKCWRWASEWGYGSMVMLNAFAYRATDPRHLHGRNVLGDNLAYLRAVAGESDLLIAAWGASSMVDTEALALMLLRYSKKGEVYHLGLTKNGRPRHPLYLANATTPTLWKQRDEPQEARRGILRVVA